MQSEEVRQTENGVKIYSYKNPALHSFHISLFVKSGCMYERDEECGITHFFEHIAIRNVNRRYDMRLYSILDKFGLEFNASTFSEMVQFYVSGADKNFTVAAEIISKILSPIILNASEVDAERKRIKAEIRESDDKNTLASFTGKIVFEGTSLSSSIVGTNKAIDRISKTKLEEYRKRMLNSRNIFFYVTGNFKGSDMDALVKFIESADIYGGVENSNFAPVPRNFCARPCEVYVKNADYTAVRFTFDLDMSRLSVWEVDLIYDMLLSGYDSKLFVEMSEKRGLFYDTVGAVERYSNIGTLHFSYEVKSKDIYDAILMTVDILNSMKQSLPDEASCMRAGYVDNAMMLYDDVRELNFTFAYDNHIIGMGYRNIEERRERYANVTPAALRAAAMEIFTLSNLTLTVKGNKKQINSEQIKNIIRRL